MPPLTDAVLDFCLGGQKNAGRSGVKKCAGRKKENPGLRRGPSQGVRRTLVDVGLLLLWLPSESRRSRESEEFSTLDRHYSSFFSAVSCLPISRSGLWSEHPRHGFKRLIFLVLSFM
jgi:hypothetical protein